MTFLLISKKEENNPELRSTILLSKVAYPLDLAQANMPRKKWPIEKRDHVGNVSNLLF